ncbi:MAG: hypothetical protein HQL50_14035 [Magnetococcales bacterium]|nr:hypothetical protein [Magnetococcales bacterium]
MAKKAIVEPVVGFWFSNVLLSILTIHVMTITSRERPFKPAVWLAQILTAMPQRMLRKQKEKDTYHTESNTHSATQ